MTNQVAKGRRDKPTVAWTPWGSFPVRTVRDAGAQQATAPMREVRRQEWLARATGRTKN